MSPLLQIILTAFCAGLAASLIAIAAGAIIVLNFLRHMEIAFIKSSEPYSILAGAATIISIIVVFLSILICPYTAYTLRHSIFEVTHRETLQLALFILAASPQIIILSSAYYSVVLYRRWKEAPYESFKDALRGANVTVTVTNARLLKDEDKFAVTEVTLRVENLPDVVTDYMMKWSPQQRDGFSADLFSDNDNRQIRFSGIKATKESGRWTFSESQSGRTVPDSDGAITVRLKHTRRYAVARSELPSTVPVEVVGWQRTARGSPGFTLFSGLVPIILEC